MRRSKLTLFVILFCTLIAQAQRDFVRWSLSPDGGIAWTIKPGDIHNDNIEMSGSQISAIVTYGIDSAQAPILKKQLIFPMLRTIPNNTHASYSRKFDQGSEPTILVNGTVIQEIPVSFHHKGMLTISSHTNTPLSINKIIFPSVDKAAFIEIYRLKNNSTSALPIEIVHDVADLHSKPEEGVYGEYVVSVQSSKKGNFTIEPNGELEFAVIYSARKVNEEPYAWSANWEMSKRVEMISGILGNLRLETPNDTINREFSFAKIRGTESIYDTKGGLMHGPGGGAYYAAIWANDQAEYINPFFPFLGNINGNESAMNSFRHFARFMNPEYKPIPSSIIAEGVSTWHGAKDRGDQAMIAYGASRFALAYGDRNAANELWPLITWCLEYLERKKSPEGVIFSNSDELENRFESGDYNLATNSLAYGGLISAAHLAMQLGKTKEAALYEKRAGELRGAIEKYFGCKVQGFDTYRYYEGNIKLRAWICYPLNMGIFDRKEATMKALFSDYLWSRNGVLTESGTKTFWDRSTLHTFKGLFAAGATDQVTPYFCYYSAKRLLGEHVPYPVEAWPEGNQRHLSAESGLYCRVVTEGLFGIEPVGFRSFTMTPLLPSGWNFMKLNNIRAFQSDFNIEVYRKGKNARVVVIQSGKVLFDKIWDQKSKITIMMK
ncbi:MAG: hypothetical protein M0R39_16265 [Prolixibacteraceae bacterium]|nr:hypothetical protein [Prolixibacteraceae bacterium]